MNNSHVHILNVLRLGSLISCGLLAGCASDTTRQVDSMEGWNRDVQSFNDDLDAAVLKPLAKGYQETVPEPVDESITAMFSNINDIGVTVNDLLQIKFAQGGMDMGRFLINTTVGVGGAFDVASDLDLPKHNEDFGQTLGFWGMPSGDYLVLPFFGPSTPRDAIGLAGDALLNPLTYISIFGGAAANAAVTGSKVVDVTDTRADALSSEKVLDEATVDRYDFIKNAYLQRREYLVHDGNPPEPELEDFDLDEAENGEGTGSAAPQPANGGLPPVTQGAETQGIQEDDTGQAPVTGRSKNMLELLPPNP